MGDLGNILQDLYESSDWPKICDELSLLEELRDYEELVNFAGLNEADFGEVGEDKFSVQCEVVEKEQPQAQVDSNSQAIELIDLTEEICDIEIDKEQTYLKIDFNPHSVELIDLTEDICDEPGIPADWDEPNIVIEPCELDEWPDITSERAFLQELEDYKECVSLFMEHRNLMKGTKI